ncbi:MAG: hypothetical protein HQM13_16925 [SAR324 cluster bacterium]|nr:hypothetical protein [SAR324 cluster bacterium]
MALKKTFFKIMILVTALVFLSVTGTFADGPKRGGTMVYVTPKIPSLNPMHGSFIAGTVATQIFAGLTRLNEKDEVVPYLAKSWSFSDGGKTITFKLAENATFHDGKPITSEDVAFSIGIVLKNHRFGKQMFGPIEEMDTSDPHTLILHLSKPHGPLLVAATSPRHLPIMPKHVYGVGDFNKNPAHKNPVGSGPFTITDKKLDEYIIMDRNKNHFDGERPYLDRVIGRVVLDKTSVRVGLEKNQFQMADAGGQIRYRDITDFEKISHLKVTELKTPNGGGTYLELNNRKEFFKNKKVRQALAYAIDRDYLADVLHDGRSKASVGPIPFSNLFFDNKLKGYPLDIEKANQLLDEAGYPKKENGIRFEFKVAYIAPPFAPDDQLIIGEHIGTSLKKVGIKVIQQPLPRSSWSAKMKNWDYDSALPRVGDKVDPAVGVGRLYRCDNIKHQPYTNTSGYCNEKVDELFIKAALEPDQGKRMAIYSEVQKLLLDEIPMIWLKDSVYWRFHHKELWIPKYGHTEFFDEMYWKTAQN